jgi:hypothetical protein
MSVRDDEGKGRARVPRIVYTGNEYEPDIASSLADLSNDDVEACEVMKFC